MKRLLLYNLVLLLLFSACEDIYNPDIDTIGNVIVADARIEKGSSRNYITLTQSQNFNVDPKSYVPVNGAELFLIDNLGIEYELPESEAGQFYVPVDVQSELEYKLKIVHGGKTFESEFESVPPAPALDTVYGVPETLILEVAGDNDADGFKELQGVQIYADMKSTPEMPNYRFTAENVLEFIWNEVKDMSDIMHYYWSKSVAGGIYNIAAPPEYSTSKEIIKHPLFFYKKTVHLEGDSAMVGWIMVLYQYAISESSYTYYKDLNTQLDSEGRIFDPVYVQARSNLRCVNDDQEVILGNFEITNKTEHRYFIRFISEQQGYEVREVDDRSPIPWNGHTIDVPPPFWQR